MCAYVSHRDLLSEQLAADAAPQFGPSVAVPLEHGGLRLAGKVVLVLVHAAVLFQTLTHIIQVYIRDEDLRHPETFGCSFYRLQTRRRGGWVPT